MLTVLCLCWRSKYVSVSSRPQVNMWLGRADIRAHRGCENYILATGWPKFAVCPKPSVGCQKQVSTFQSSKYSTYWIFNIIFALFLISGTVKCFAAPFQFDLKLKGLKGLYTRYIYIHICIYRFRIRRRHTGCQLDDVEVQYSHSLFQLNVAQWKQWFRKLMTVVTVNVAWHLEKSHIYIDRLLLFILPGTIKIPPKKTSILQSPVKNGDFLGLSTCLGAQEDISKKAEPFMTSQHFRGFTHTFWEMATI